MNGAPATNAAPTTGAGQRGPRSALVSFAKKVASFVAGLGIGGAIVGFVAHDLQKRRDDAIALLEEQVRKLYLPFYLENVRNDGAWCVFVEGQWLATNPEKPSCQDWTKAYWMKPMMPDEDVLRWRTQIRSNFQPLNLEMERIILENRGLLVGGVMPPKWQALLDHVSAYRAIIAEWRDDDRERRHSQFNQVEYNVPVRHQWPGGITECSQKLLEQLQREQAYLRERFYRMSTSGAEREVPEACR